MEGFRRSLPCRDECCGALLPSRHLGMLRYASFVFLTPLVESLMIRGSSGTDSVWWLWARMKEGMVEAVMAEAIVHHFWFTFVPATLDLGHGEHAVVAAHVSEGSLVGVVGSVVGIMEDMRDGLAGSLRLNRGLVAGTTINGIWLAAILGDVRVYKIDEIL
ncbi:hypothetical protein GYH30_042696 [Glycine max]|nr:hypothetical protein GYH30_042696 [Glycine max]